MPDSSMSVQPPSEADLPPEVTGPVSAVPRTVAGSQSWTKRGLCVESSLIRRLSRVPAQAVRRRSATCCACRSACSCRVWTTPVSGPRRFRQIALGLIARQVVVSPVFQAGQPATVFIATDPTSAR